MHGNVCGMGLSDHLLMQDFGLTIPRVPALESAHFSSTRCVGAVKRRKGQEHITDIHEARAMTQSSEPAMVTMQCPTREDDVKSCVMR